MSFSDYSGLKTAAASWLMRDDLTDSIPDFITLCESRNNLRLRVREMLTSATLAPNSSNICTLPTDYVEALAVVAQTDPVSTLTPISRELALQSYNVADFPYFYNVFGSTLTAYPLTTSNIVLDYYQKIPALSTTNTTNFLLTKAPQIYLYGTLIEAAPFLEDDQRITTWKALYEDAVLSLQSADTRAMHGQARARVRNTCP